MITEAEMAECSALCEAATEGPWLLESDRDEDAPLWCVSHPKTVCDATTIANFLEDGKDDGAFIAQARTAMPRLIEEVRRLTAERDAIIADNATIMATNAELTGEVTDLRSVLTAIIARSKNGEIGTSKVLDMRAIAEAALSVRP